MRLQNITLLASTALSLLVSAVIMNPVMANPATEIAQRQNINTTAKTETITGVVKSIAGELVTVDVDGGTYKTLRIERRIMGILGLVPGVRISATVLRGGYMVENVAVIPNMKVTTSAAAARTTTITTTTTTQTQTQTQTQTTTPRRTPLAPTPMRSVTPPVSRPQMAPIPPQKPMAPVQTQPAAPPVRGLW